MFAILYRFSLLIFGDSVRVMVSRKEAVFNGFHILLDHLASSLIYQLESTKVYQSLPTVPIYLRRSYCTVHAMSIQMYLFQLVSGTARHSEEISIQRPDQQLFSQREGISLAGNFSCSRRAYALGPVFVIRWGLLLACIVLGF